MFSSAAAFNQDLMVCTGYASELIVEGNLGARWFLGAAAAVNAKGRRTTCGTERQRFGCGTAGELMATGTSEKYNEIKGKQCYKRENCIICDMGGRRPGSAQRQHQWRAYGLRDGRKM